MHIAFFTDCYRPTRNGVVTSITEAAAELHRRGHTITVITAHYPGYAAYEPGVYRVPSLPFKRDIELRLGLANSRFVRQIVESRAIDVIHTHTEFSLGWAARRLATKLDLPLVHTTHTMYEAYRHYLPLGRLIPSSTIRGYWARFLRHHQALICPSRKAQTYFAHITPTPRSVVIGNSLSPTRFAPRPGAGVSKSRVLGRLGIPPRAHVLVFVGRLGHEKRVAALLGALIPLLRQESACYLLLVGGGPCRRQLARMAARGGVGDRVILPGYLTWEQVCEIYATAQLFLTASVSEVHPMTLIEAAHSGLPAVVRRDDAYTGLVEHGYNGYQVNTDEEIAARAGELLRDNNKRQTLSQNALTIADRFRVEDQVSRLESLYRDLLQER